MRPNLSQLLCPLQSMVKKKHNKIKRIFEYHKVGYCFSECIQKLNKREKHLAVFPQSNIKVTLIGPDGTGGLQFYSAEGTQHIPQLGLPGWAKYDDWMIEYSKDQ